MTRDELTKWALTHGWRMIDGMPSLSIPGLPNHAFVRLRLAESDANIEVKKASGNWEAVSGAPYADIEADERNGLPRGLGLETLSSMARSLLSSMDMKRVFTEVFDKKIWGDIETVSGPGSMIEYTANLRKELPGLLAKFGIASVLDAPCGDMNWMRLVLAENPSLQYTGGDIVKGLVEQNARNYAGPNVRLVELDITRDALPKADMMICRDCLFHLPQQKIFDFIDNFRNSDVEYLLTTSYITDGNFNTDIHTGFFFPINLLHAPYNFPSETLYAIDDWIEGHHPRRMYLWRRSQIPAPSA